MTQQQDELLFALYAGERDFANAGHLHNFLKYLFSATKGHAENPRTHRNFYIQPQLAEDKHAFVEDPKSDYNSFKNKWWNELKDHNSLRNNLFYIGFFLEVDGKLITNILNDKNGDGRAKLNLDNETLNAIVGQYYQGKKEKLFEAVQHVLDKYDNFTEFGECTREEKVAIESRIHNLILDSRDLEINPLLSISHHDQDMYHIHTLY